VLHQEIFLRNHDKQQKRPKLQPMKRTLWNIVKALFRYIVILPKAFPQYAVKLVNSVAYHLYFFRIIGRQFDGLNLGSGSAKIMNFCNIDANPRASCDIVARIDKIKLKSNSVRIIYSSHVLEHIPRDHAKIVLAEWHRVLKPGGKLYMCVPDLEVLFKVYMDNIPFYHTDKGRYLVDRACFFTYGGEINKYEFHYNGYSFVTLESALQMVGFKEIQRFDRSKLDFVEFEDISMVKIGDIPMSLNVVASK
jgi:SAM-dependent methyltransferase